MSALTFARMRSLLFRGKGRGSAARGGLAGRRLQAAVIALVVLAGTATCVVALGLLANAHSPFDRAFAAARGADVTAAVDTAVAPPPRLAATARLAGVTAAAGPFPEVSATAQVTTPGISGSSQVQLQIVGRASPGGQLDDLTLDDGHWPDSAGQIVMARGDGIFTGSVLTIDGKELAVTGVAESVTGTAAAWVLPSEVAALAGRAGQGQAQMLYRFASAGSTSAITADIAELRAALPRGALLTHASYLSVRQSEQGSIAPFVPFIIAFGVIALVTSVLIVVNVVSGAVTAGTTRIGVLKSIGLSPVQVVACYVLLVAGPGLAGCAAGTVLGNLLAVPMLKVNASVYQVGTLTVPFWVDAAVPLGALALTVAGAIGPASRAGRMSAVQAIAAGRAPRPAHGYLAHRALARMASAPRALTLGLAAPFARPARTLVTVAAVMFGAAAVTFGIGLTASLNRVVSDRPQAALPVQVSLSRPGPAPGGPVVMTAAQQRAVVSALAAQPGTLHYLAVSTGQVGLSGAAGSVSITAYRGAPAWSGFPLISGRWYSGPGEADVNTLSPHAYANAVSAALGSSYSAADSSAGSGHFLAVLTLVSMLVILIMAVAGLGVLNTVALQIRERAHDIGVFKAIGMTPRQTLAMIVCSVAATGLAAGVAAVPAGVYLHHGVVPVMVHAANSGYPPSLLLVYPPWELALLALAGLVIAVAGALGPASWAAHTRTAFALRAE
jgi:putative ABC transport system permease protein